MVDLVYSGPALLFFALPYDFVTVCERFME